MCYDGLGVAKCALYEFHFTPPLYLKLDSSVPVQGRISLYQGTKEAMTESEAL